MDTRVLDAEESKKPALLAEWAAELVSAAVASTDSSSTPLASTGQIEEVQELDLDLPKNAANAQTKTAWQQKLDYINICKPLIRNLTTADEGTPRIATAMAALRGLVRLTLTDAQFADELVLESDIYQDIIVCAGPAQPTSQGESGSKSSSSSLSSASKTTATSPTAPVPKKSTSSSVFPATTTAADTLADLRPMATVLLAKAFEMTRSKDLLQNKSLELFLSDIGSGKVQIRRRGYLALHLFGQVDLSIACAILSKEGLLVELMDSVELEPEETQIILAETLSMACADAKTRTTIALHCSEFLKSIVHGGATKNQHLKGAAAVALTKITMTESQQDPSVGLNGLDASGNATGSSTKSSSETPGNEADLAKLFSKLLVSQEVTGDQGVNLNAVEGLAYASIQPRVKDNIIKDKALLLTLFKLANDTKSNPLRYGLAMIFNNLTAFRKRLSAEQEQMQKLKKMAGTLPKSQSRVGALQDDVDDPLDSEPVVMKRNVVLIQLGIMPALHAIGQQASDNIRQVLAQVLRNIVTPTETRGALVQQGIVKLLVPISQISTPEAAKSAATQALCKLSITLDPKLTFKNQRIPELVKPFVWLLQSTDQLCQFESLMALTNLGSMGDGQILMLIIQEGGVDHMENLQFSENTLVRRAATEALCNMIFFEPVFERYSDPKTAKNKIHLLLALCDADDFMTRRAASGALAVLSTSKDVCKMVMDQERGLDILMGLISIGIKVESVGDDKMGPSARIKEVREDGKDEFEEEEEDDVEQVLNENETSIDEDVAVSRMDELRHRGAECIKNLISIGGKANSEEIKRRGGILKLVALIKASQSEAVQYCSLEGLKAMSEQGIQVSL